MANAFQQLNTLWGQLGINQRVTIALALLAVVGGMAALMLYASKPRMELLYGRMDSTDMTEVAQLIKEQDIPFEISGTSIYVPAEHVNKLRMEVASQGLVSGGTVGLELFDEPKFGISDFAQKVNHTRAIQGELQRSILTIQGVRGAKVMIVVPDNKLILDQNKARPTASVVVDTGARELSNEQVLGVQRLVAHAVEGLRAGEVSVVDNRGISLSDRVNETGEFGSMSSHMKYRQSLEGYFAKKVEDLLMRVVGPGNVVARVSAEVDTNATTEVKEIFDPESQVARTENVLKDQQESVKMAVSPPIVGVDPNTPEGIGGGAAQEPLRDTSESKRNEKQVAYEISKVSTETVRRPGTISRISAAVFINKQAAPGAAEGEPAFIDRTPEELESLRIMISNALGVDTRFENTGESLVTLQETVFSVGPENYQPTVVEQYAPYIDSAKKFLGIGVALLMFLLFLRMLKKQTPKMPTVEVMDDMYGLGGEGGMGGTALARSGNVSPRPTPELLNELIQQRPDNVSQALKEWSALK